MIVNALRLLLFLSADVLRESAAFSPAPRRKGAGGPLVRPPRSGRGPDVAGGAAPSGAGTRDGEAAAPGDATARPGPLVSLLDLNGDGRVDAEDLGVLMGQFESLMDVNGDGRVDADDARAALSIFALSSALVVSPGAAVAKGGGHGGGHGGHAHWHGRRHRSGGGHSHYSHDDEYEPWKRRVGHAETLTLSPNACSNLPLEGEVVDVLSGVGPAGSYVPATVTSVDGGSDWLVCNFVAEPGNGEAPSHLTTAKNIQLYALTTALALYVGGDWRFDAEFKAVPSRVDGDFPLPASGTYRGWSDERDGSVFDRQDVRTRLVFGDDGTISGSGRDSFDGTYEVSGEWRGGAGEYLLRWTEDYDDFSVEVRCRMKKGRKKIRGVYESSRGVGGNLELEIE